MNSVMEAIQDDVFGRVNGDAPLATVVVLEERKGVAANDVAQVLGSQTNRGGLKGACVLVEMPYFFVDKPDATGPRVEMELGVRCIEKPLVNRGPGGSGITAEQLAIRVVQLLHHFIISDRPITLTARRIEAVVYETGEREYRTAFHSMLQLNAVPKVARPTITQNAGLVTIAAPIASSVYYTLDGSFPAPGTAAAQLYAGAILDSRGLPLTDSTGSPINASGQFPSTAGATVRAVAYPNDTNSQASDVAYLNLN